MRAMFWTTLAIVGAFDWFTDKPNMEVFALLGAGMITVIAAKLTLEDK